MLLYLYIFLGHAQENGLLAMCMYLNTTVYCIYYYGGGGVERGYVDIWYLIFFRGCDIW